MELGIAKWLHDALPACDEIQAFAAGRSRSQFLDDRGLQLVIWKLTEIVGEALRQAEIAELLLSVQIPELRDIVNTRNRITHGYNAVNFNLLWDIVSNDSEPLQDRLAAMLQGASPHQNPET